MTIVNVVLLIVLVASLGVPAAHGKAADKATVLCPLDVCHGSDSAVSSVADAPIMLECGDALGRPFLSEPRGIPDADLHRFLIPCLKDHPPRFSC